MLVENSESRRRIEDVEKVNTVKDFLLLVSDTGKRNMSEKGIGYRYVRDRGVLSEQIEKYELGTIDRVGLATLKRRATVEVLEEPIISRMFSQVEDTSIIFTIKNGLDMLLGLELRSSLNRKYDKYYLDVGKVDATFFGLPQNIEKIWMQERVFLTEGIFDMLSFQQLFDVPVLSTMTQTIQRRQWRFLERFAREIYLLFDKEAQPIMRDVERKTDGKYAIRTLDWRKRGDLDLRGIKDINEIVRTYGNYRSKRLFQKQFVGIEDD